MSQFFRIMQSVLVVFLLLVAFDQAQQIGHLKYQIETHRNAIADLREADHRFRVHTTEFDQWTALWALEHSRQFLQNADQKDGFTYQYLDDELLSPLEYAAMASATHSVLGYYQVFDQLNSAQRFVQSRDFPDRGVTLARLQKIWEKYMR